VGREILLFCTRREKKKRKKKEMKRGKTIDIKFGYRKEDVISRYPLKNAKDLLQNEEVRNVLVPSLWLPVIKKLIEYTENTDAGYDLPGAKELIFEVYPDYDSVVKNRTPLSKFYSTHEDNLLDAHMTSEKKIIPGSMKTEATIGSPISVFVSDTEKSAKVFANPIAASVAREMTSNTVETPEKRIPASVFGYNAVARHILTKGDNVNPIAHPMVGAVFMDDDSGRYVGGLENQHAIAGEISSWMFTKSSPANPVRVHHWMLSQFGGDGTTVYETPESEAQKTARKIITNIASDVIQAKATWWYPTVSDTSKLMSLWNKGEYKPIEADKGKTKKISAEKTPTMTTPVEFASQVKMTDANFNVRLFSNIERYKDIKNSVMVPEDILKGGVVIPTGETPLTRYVGTIGEQLRNALRKWSTTASDLKIQEGAVSNMVEDITKEKEECNKKIRELLSKMKTTKIGERPTDSTYVVPLKAIPPLLYQTTHEHHLEGVHAHIFSYESLLSAKHKHKQMWGNV
jgi:hypothetical protein